MSTPNRTIRKAAAIRDTAAKAPKKLPKLPGTGKRKPDYEVPKPVKPKPRIK